MIKNFITKRSFVIPNGERNLCLVLVNEDTKASI